MNENPKVLWVDDQIENGGFEQGFTPTADKNGIDLVPFSNWEDAEKELRRDFESFSAIILDANCKLKKMDNKTDEFFIPKVLQSLARIFTEKVQYIPWYILSAGTMDKFDDVRNIANNEFAAHQEEWGNMVYLKDAIDNSEYSIDVMFSNINRVAKNKPEYKVAYYFQNVFKYLGEGEGKFIGKHARKIMMGMLRALYFPEDNKYFKYEGNPLRKVMEYIFRAAYDYGLLPKECFDRDDQLNLLESNRYMSGLVTKYSNMRYGTNEDKIFSEFIGNITLQLLNFTNALSHTNPDNKPSPYTIDDEDLEITENEKELFFSYVLQLCHVIKFFGAFVETHPDKNENMKKRTEVNGDIPFNRDRALIQKDENGLYVGPLPKRFEEYVGKSAKIGNVNPNTKDDNTEYPYFARIKIGK